MDDSGKREQYGEGKAMREPSTGKGRYDLISPFMLEELAKWMEEGAVKYADRNWEKGGIKFSRFVDSALRHMSKYVMGMEDENHLAGVMFNVMALMHFRALGYTVDDDLPHYLTNRPLFECGHPCTCCSNLDTSELSVDAIDEAIKAINDIDHKKRCAEAIAAIKSNYPSSGYSMLCAGLDKALELLEREIKDG